MQMQGAKMTHCALTLAGQDDKRVTREQHGTPVEGELVDSGRRSGRGRVCAELNLPPVQGVVRRMAGGGELEHRGTTHGARQPSRNYLK